MKLSGILIIASLLIASVLSIGGAYVTIDNLVHPQGNLFEGITLFSLGVIFFLLFVIASSIGKAIVVFTEVYTQQVEMQTLMNEHLKNMNKPKSLGDILGGMNSSISITDLNTGETIARPLDGGNSMENIKEIITNAFKKIRQEGFDIDLGPKEPKDMNRQELELELSNAVKSDNFERATEIRELLRKLNEEDGGNEKKDN